MMLSDVGVFKSKVDEYIQDSNETVEFNLARNADDVTGGKFAFKPDMSHQIFGLKEQIFGYKDLKISITYSSAKLNVLVNIKYEKKINSEHFGGASADNILPKLLKSLPPGYKTNENDFISSLENEKDFKPHGEMIHRYERSKENVMRTFEIYTCDISQSGFKEYHDKIQTFLLWFIDGASYIDVDDDCWEFFTVYEKCTIGNDSIYAFVGYCTVYNFYAFPENKRPRISQFLVLPPFQRQGHGSELLEAIYRIMCNRKHVLDITVEDPSKSFQLLRDFIDSKKCANLECFSKKNLKQGFSKKMVAESKAKFKINRKQTRRIYEILRLKNTELHNPEDFEHYKKSVVARLEIPYRTRLSRCLSRDAASKIKEKILPSKEEQEEILESQFAEAIEEYVVTVKKLELSSYFRTSSKI